MIRVDGTISPVTPLHTQSLDYPLSMQLLTIHSLPSLSSKEHSRVMIGNALFPILTPSLLLALQRMKLHSQSIPPQQDSKSALAISHSKASQFQ